MLNGHVQTFGLRFNCCPLNTLWSICFYSYQTRYRGCRNIVNYLYWNSNVRFVFWGFFVTLENFSLISKRHNYRWRSANFDLNSTLMVIEHLNVAHLLWLIFQLTGVWTVHTSYIYKKACKIINHEVTKI